MELPNTNDIAIDAALTAVERAVSDGASAEIIRSFADALGVHARRKTRGAMMCSVDGAKAWWSGPVSMTPMGRRSV